MTIVEITSIAFRLILKLKNGTGGYARGKQRAKENGEFHDKSFWKPPQIHTGARRVQSPAGVYCRLWECLRIDRQLPLSDFERTAGKGLPGR